MTLLLTSAGYGSAIVPGFNTTSDGRNDDGTYTSGGCNNSSDGGFCDGTLVPIGFDVNFYGVDNTALYVNTNGNVTFDIPLPTFTPFGLNNVPAEIIAPFFADVDTRNPASGVVTFGGGTFDSEQAFGVNWINVGYFNQKVDKTDSFQLLLVNRADTGAGNFDLIFNYDQVQFETGDASHGTDGLGGESAYIGFSDGTGNDGASFQLPGSGVPGTFIDNGTTPLIDNSLNSDVAGRYIFASRGGQFQTQPVPEPGTSVLLGLATMVMPYFRRFVLSFAGRHQ